MEKNKYLLILFGLIVTFGRLSAVTVRTPKGGYVTVESKIEYYNTQAKIDDLRVEYNKKYPNATIIGNPTSTYNCHYYAWSMTEGNTTPYWMNDPSLYINDGSYVQTFQILAEKVYYYSGDHSAVPSPTVSGMYESKWGN